jgi:hypothetical protein
MVVGVTIRNFFGQTEKMMSGFEIYSSSNGPVKALSGIALGSK